MNNQFVPYDTAKKLKELGFDEPVMSYYNQEQLVTMLDEEDMNEGKEISAPLWQQVEEWLWEEHKIFIEVRFFISTKYGFDIWDNHRGRFNNQGRDFDSPIQAKQEGIKAALNHLYKKK